MQHRIILLSLLFLLLFFAGWLGNSAQAFAQANKAKSSGYIGETEKNKGSKTNSFNGAMADLDKCLKLDVPTSFKSGQAASFNLIAQKPTSTLATALATTPAITVQIIMDTAQDAVTANPWEEDAQPKNLKFNGNATASFKAASGNMHTLVSFTAPGVTKPVTATLKVTVNGVVRIQQITIVP